ncbi:MAG: ribonuclease III [Thermodesulfobacteriota bacterium]
MKGPSFMEGYLKGLAGFNETLSPPFKDFGLFKEVFTHSSFLNEAAADMGTGSAGKAARSNERLEFLGDSVLGAAISHILFTRYPEMQEGELTRLRARLVNRRVLCRLAEELRLGEHLLMGRGMAASGGAGNERILAGLFEAYLGARYIEEGFNPALLGRVERLFSGLIEEAVTEPGYFDYKPALQELAQRLFVSTPVYSVTGTSGSPHERIYEVEVSIGGRVRGKGAGRSKKKAEQAAAGMALEEMERAEGAESTAMKTGAEGRETADE